MTDKIDKSKIEELCKKQIVPENMRCPCGLIPLPEQDKKKEI